MTVTEHTSAVSRALFLSNYCNARLRATVRELLAALQWIADHGDTTEGRPACYAMRAHARDAIARARRS